MKSQTNKFITPLRMNRLRGRMLILPSQNKKSKTELLLLYGHHASLERMAGIAENLSQYTNVSLPDLPGFGGMDSFYKINKKPTLDNYADYLAAFIKLRYKRKRFSIVSMSFAFLIVTKMLQKYPELTKKIDFVVSTVGFVHYQDFRLPKAHIFGLKLLSTTCKHRLPAAIFRRVFLSRTVIRLTYKSNASNHSKMKDAGSDQELNKRIKAEIKLWHSNDVRTRMFTLNNMFKVNLCDKKIDLPVHHVSVANDRYFDNNVVEQHMRIIYSDFINMPSNMPAHMPSIVATKEEADPFIPKKLRQLLK